MHRSAFEDQQFPRPKFRASALILHPKRPPPREHIKILITSRMIMRRRRPVHPEDPRAPRLSIRNIMIHQQRLRRRRQRRRNLRNIKSPGFRRTLAHKSPLFINRRSSASSRDHQPRTPYRRSAPKAPKKNVVILSLSKDLKYHPDISSSPFENKHSNTETPPPGNPVPRLASLEPSKGSKPSPRRRIGVVGAGNGREAAAGDLGRASFGHLRLPSRNTVVRIHPLASFPSIIGSRKTRPDAIRSLETAAIETTH
jgi:hypothetical protein